MPETELRRITELLKSGELQKARIDCGRLLAANPDHPLVLRQMAIIATDEGQMGEAERLLRRIVELQPEVVAPIADLARFYESGKDYLAALTWYERACELAPEIVEFHLCLAQALMIVGQVDRASGAFQSCLGVEPDNHRAQLGQAHCLRMLGDRDECITLYRICLQYPETRDEAAWSLASYRGFEFSEDEADGIADQAGADSSALLNFAMGRILEQRGEFSAAWSSYRLANQKQKQDLAYDHEQTCQRLDRIPQVFSRELLDRERDDVPQESCPVFIVGLPRSGSTLVEQILTSHPLVEGTTELPYMNEIATTLLASPVPLARLSDDRLSTLAQQYLEKTRFHRLENCPYFVDKLPDNFASVGLIHMLMPEAVIIDVRRDPVDTCVGNYRQYFPSGKGFSCDLEQTAEFYRRYLALMEYWQSVLPGRVLTIHYEKLVSDTESEIRRLLGHSGLEWHDDCLSFHDNPRPVVTASSEQVREPVYSESIGYWKNFEQELEGLASSFR